MQTSGTPQVGVMGHQGQAEEAIAMLSASGLAGIDWQGLRLVIHLASMVNGRQPSTGDQRTTGWTG